MRTDIVRRETKGATDLALVTRPTAASCWQRRVTDSQTADRTWIHMFTTQVALVPFRAEDENFNRQLLLVASALQTQLLRDFGPVWGMSGVVAPFLRLEDVPPQYFPVVIFDGKLPDDHHGFHLAIDGRPFALIQKDDGWSLTASHELLELVCDPSGSRTLPGPSLKDAYDQALNENPGQAAKPQGMVDYLVEICDPCDQSTYEIDGVVVSDFVTPSYYDSFESDGGRYSFTGEVTRPRQILDGGYISWRTRQPRATVWQAFATTPASSSAATSAAPAPSVQGTPIDHLSIRRLGDAPPCPAGAGATGDADSRSPFSRDQVDSRGKRDRAAASARASAADPTWAAYEEAFRDDIETLVALLRKPAPPSIPDIIDLLQKTGASVSVTQLEEFNLPPSSTLDANRKYHVILAALKEQEKIAGLFGPNLSDPDLASWLLRLAP